MLNLKNEVSWVSSAQDLTQTFVIQRSFNHFKLLAVIILSLVF